MKMSERLVPDNDSISWNLLNQFRDHAIILRSFNLLMIETKHESRYNHTELLYLIEEVFLWRRFPTGYICTNFVCAQYGFGILDCRTVCGRARYPGQGKSLCFRTEYHCCVCSETEGCWDRRIANASLSHLRGAISCQAMSLGHRIMRALLRRPLQRKPAEEWSEEGRELMETCGKRSDFVDFASLRPIINETQRNTEWLNR